MFFNFLIIFGFKQMVNQENIESFIEELKNKGFTCFSNLSLSKFRIISQSGFGIILKRDNPIFGGSIQDCSFLHFSPEILLKPVSREQIQNIIIASRTNKIPITFAAGKTGLSGGFANPFVVVDLECLKSLETSYNINKNENWVEIDQKFLVSDLIRKVPMDTNDKFIFPVQPSSAFKLPVRVGGLIATNASGVTSGKLGAIEDWIESMEILNPKGEFVKITENDPYFPKIVGGNGRHGLILNAKIKLASNPENLRYKLLYGSNLEDIFTGLQAIQDKEIFPLIAEFILSINPLKGLFGQLFSKNQKEPARWAILLKGSEDILENFEKTAKESSEFDTKNLNLDEFKVYLEERASMALQTISSKESRDSDFVLYPGFEDILISPLKLLSAFEEINKVLAEMSFNQIVIGYGHINFRKGQGILMHLRVPVSIEDLYTNKHAILRKVSHTIAKTIVMLQSKLDVLTKAEHSPGIIYPWMEHYKIKDLTLWKNEMDQGYAFYNPHFELYSFLCSKFGISLKNPLNESDSRKILEEMFFLYYSGNDKGFVPN
nr:FAD binding domain protein [Candidatus Prometheoarchaeum syntrophicum]